ncbi:MAG: divalent metal cation transporter, partial [Bryobacteraceae bacterium]|nr:divalent metal cation transporter [Bryobacteraceae bacterium]
ILGATVMPHNLYLHSALVQTRRIGESVAEKAAACRFNFIDSVVALNAALFVNAAILIMAASVFFKNGVVVNEIQQAHVMLAPLLGTTLASVLFAVALLCSGQSSTLTGTLAGQIVMEGFVNLRLRPWLRRVITRLLAIIPAVLVISISGEKATYQLLILSQVILSLQLPFAVIPLIHFTSDRERMGSFANRRSIQVLAWVAAIIIVGLNVRLVLQQFEGWSPQVQLVAAPIGFGLFALLGWMTFRPWLPAWARRQEAGRPGGMVAPVPPEPLAVPSYQRILVPLDHSSRDRAALAHAAQLARIYGATLHLFHVEEDATSAVYGGDARTAEVEQGLVYLQNLKQQLDFDAERVSVEVRASQSPGDAIVHYARELRPDLVVMAAHGHRGLKDLALGQTIDSVRHSLRVPVLIVTD